MSELRQLLFGALAAVISAAIILGGLAISMAESGIEMARQPEETASPTMPPGTTDSPLETQPQEVLELTPTIPTPTHVCQGPPGWLVIQYQAGDSMDSLALEYGLSTEELIAANCDVLNPPLGTDLYVPTSTPTNTPSSTPTLTPSPTFTATAHTPKTPTSRAAACVPNPPASWVRYRIRQGDTYYQLARDFRINVSFLMRVNCSKYLKAGDTLWVPNVPKNTPTSTRVVPTNTPVIPTSTPVTPSATSPSPSATPITPSPVPHTPTVTLPPETNTPAPPTLTLVPPTATPLPSSPTPPLPTNTFPPPPSRATPTPTPVQEESAFPELMMYWDVSRSGIQQVYR